MRKKWEKKIEMKRERAEGIGSRTE